MLKNRDSPPRTRAMLAAVAVVLLAAVALTGWHQWSRRAASPIDTVRKHRSEATGASIGESIHAYLLSAGTEIAEEGFKPAWGAEELEDGSFVVAYVFEVGRDSCWVSWRVHPGTGEVEPLDDTAGELWR